MDPAVHDLNQWRSLSAVTLLVLLLAWESTVPFFTCFAGRTGERVRHGLKNLVLGFLNSLLTGLGFAALWWTAAQWAQAHGFGLLNWLPLPPWARLPGAFLLFDAWMYCRHRHGDGH
jgi:sterol desaturase/sphingolipid hydroxylase (fatty acid hydroxylase superfamily)